MWVVPFRLNTVLGTALAASLLSGLSRAQTVPLPKISPAELIARAVRQEAEAQKSPVRHMFRDRKQTARGSQTRVMAETLNAVAAITIAYDDKPLTAQQRQAELDRLRRLASSPDDLKAKHRRELEDAERASRIVRALPDAFLYEYAGSELGSEGIGIPGRPLLRLNFRPNPRYQPPTQVERVLTGMQGYVLIDPAKERIAKIDGTLARDVGFGWGILGHLDRGGHFVVHQGEIEAGDWEITRMELAFTGKILLFKNLSIQSTEVFSDFQPVPPDLTFAKAVDMLAKQEAEFAQSQNRAHT